MRRRGSNQYQDNWRLSYGTKKSIYYLLFCMFMVALVGFVAQINMKKLEARAEVISPLAVSAAVVVPTPTPVLIKQKNFVDYAKRVAGDKAKLLIALANCEGLNSKRKVNINSNGSADYGEMQVNTVHFDRVPGETYEEKVKWLSDPENNALFGYMLLLEQNVGPWKSSESCWRKGL